MKNLTLIRESFDGKDGKKYWAYMVKGNVRGREVKVDFVPKDIGGYEPLDIVFDVQDKAELIIGQEQITDSYGNKNTYTTYKAQNVDEFGIVYDCGIKPQRDSDKSLLTMLLNVLNVQAKAEEEKKAKALVKEDKK